MAQQTTKYCPKCRDNQYFEWQIEREDTDNNNLDFWLMCCSCGFVGTEPFLDSALLNYPHENEEVPPEPLKQRLDKIFEEATTK